MTSYSILLSGAGNSNTGGNKIQYLVASCLLDVFQTPLGTDQIGATRKHTYIAIFVV